MWTLIVVLTTYGFSVSGYQSESLCVKAMNVQARHIPPEKLIVASCTQSSLAKISSSDTAPTVVAENTNE